MKIDKESLKKKIRENQKNLDKLIVNINHCCKCGKLELRNGANLEGEPLVVQAIVYSYSNGEITIEEFTQIGLYFSSGLCKMCAREVLKETIRKKQRREGYFDCFGTAKGYCSQTNCKYYDICVINNEEEKSHQQWLKKRFFKTLNPSPL